MPGMLWPEDWSCGALFCRGAEGPRQQRERLQTVAGRPAAKLAEASRSSRGEALLSGAIKFHLPTGGLESIVRWFVACGSCRAVYLRDLGYGAIRKKGILPPQKNAYFWRLE